jgi:HEAT repeats
MKRLPLGLSLVLALLCAIPAQAQFLFRKTRPNPSQRVPELILILKTETDERKRAQAAEELRDYDPATFMEMIPVLLDVLQHDQKMSVRLEALNSLAKYRPVQPTTLSAIEKAASDDESWRVRWQAKTTLPKLQLSLLTTRKGNNSAPGNHPTTDEPPLLEVGAMPPMNPLAAPIPTGDTPPRPFPPMPPAKTPTQPGQGPALFP